MFIHFVFLEKGILEAFLKGRTLSEDLQGVCISFIQELGVFSEKEPFPDVLGNMVD